MKGDILVTWITQKIKIRDNWTCQKCGRKGVPLDVHHIQPRFCGGDNDPSNLITLCKSCHMSIKHPMPPSVLKKSNALNVGEIIVAVRPDQAAKVANWPKGRLSRLLQDAIDKERT